MTLLGLKVRLPTGERCRRCGSDVAVITRPAGRHFADLHCATCVQPCGSLSEGTGKMIAKIASMFGAPEVIAIRRRKPVSRTSGNNSPGLPAR